MKNYFSNYDYVKIKNESKSQDLSEKFKHFKQNKFYKPQTNLQNEEDVILGGGRKNLKVIGKAESRVYNLKKYKGMGPYDEKENISIKVSFQDLKEFNENKDENKTETQKLKLKQIRKIMKLLDSQRSISVSIKKSSSTKKAKISHNLNSQKSSNNKVVIDKTGKTDKIDISSKKSKTKGNFRIKSMNINSVNGVNSVNKVNNVNNVTIGEDVKNVNSVNIINNTEENTIGNTIGNKIKENNIENYIKEKTLEKLENNEQSKKNNENKHINQIIKNQFKTNPKLINYKFSNDIFNLENLAEIKELKEKDIICLKNNDTSSIKLVSKKSQFNTFMKTSSNLVSVKNKEKVINDHIKSFPQLTIHNRIGNSISNTEANDLINDLTNNLSINLTSPNILTTQYNFGNINENTKEKTKENIKENIKETNRLNTNENNCLNTYANTNSNTFKLNLNTNNNSSQDFLNGNTVCNTLGNSMYINISKINKSLPKIKQIPKPKLSSIFNITK